MVPAQRPRLAIAITAASVFALALAGAGATDTAPPGKIEPRLLEQLAAREGEVTFWPVLRDKADLAAAPRIPSHAARGRFVVDRLQQVADRSQARLRALLEHRNADFAPFWIVNTVRVRGGEALVREVAALPEVERVLADRVFRVPEPQPGSTEQTIQAVEWNVDRIGAPQVWATFGVRGTGIVVASIDTGVQFDHPALVAQYRGNLGGGTFDHNYNWFDPSSVCGTPSRVPCDNNSHGTHVTGTMVGDDAGANQIGVAPGARWIAAKGCELSSCSFEALLASGQWILAPTDLNGLNPRPDLRPHVVNNSWGGGGGSTFYQETVNAWVASGIFPAFANGNSGPSCQSSGSPGDYVNTYSAGAFDINNVIAGFSSRGPSLFGGELKPNVGAPGVNVRSSVPTNTYSAFSGTSMASPHVAATVALMWAAAPAIERDIAGTRAILDQTAGDVADSSCGGTAADNNVWGEGRLNAFAAVDQSPRGPTGTLTGTVTDAGTGAAIGDATVEVTGPATRSTTTNAAGAYSMRLPVGTYTVSVRAFGYVAQSVAGVVVSEGQTTVRNFALTRAPAHAVSGRVLDEAGNAVAGATVTILDTPIAPATTDATGFYRFASVPDGTYQARAEAGRCNAPQTQQLIVDADETLDLALPRRADAFGYTCRIVTSAFIDANTVLPLTGDDASVAVSLPFQFSLYGQGHQTVHVSTNGFVNFVAPDATFTNGSIPSTLAPNGAVYGFWDDLFVDASASVRTQLVGSQPNRQFVIEWRNVSFFGDATRRVRFEIVLHENGRVLLQYADLAQDAREQGSSATVGLENQAGSVAFQYSLDEPVLSTGLALLFQVGSAPPPPPPPPVPPPPPPPPDCTITGTPGNDRITGTAGNDVICTLAGNDEVRAGGGNDTIRGDDGDDKLEGEGGDDTIRGGNGLDQLDGGAGNDSLFGDAGFDRLDGREGTDFCDAGLDGGERRNCETGP